MAISTDLSSPTQSSSEPYEIAFQEGISVGEHDGAPVIHGPTLRAPLKGVSPAIREALTQLSSTGVTFAELAARVEADEGPASLPRLFFFLERLKKLGLLTFTVVSRTKGRLATLIPLRGARAPAVPCAPGPYARYVLSRFACMRRSGDKIVLETPLGRGTVVVHGTSGLAAIQSFIEPGGVTFQMAPSGDERALAGLLVGAGVLTIAELEDELPLAFWSYHDLLFHMKSRLGLSSERCGATFPFAGKIEPLDVLKSYSDRPRIELFRPDIQALKANDVPFSRVLEERRSIRAHADRPIHVDQLGELLYRAARVRSVMMSGSEPRYPATNRPYPSGGACYSLEIYLAVRVCEELRAGLYHYDPQGHALTLISDRTRAVDTTVSVARDVMVVPAEPQVVVVLCSRFGRAMWKYESTAYAVILKDVGALFQTLYLVATAMGLAACALGNGDSAVFADAAGLDYLVESSVGEMAIGVPEDGYA